MPICRHSTASHWLQFALRRRLQTAATKERDRSYGDPIRDSRIAPPPTISCQQTRVARANREWLFRLRFVQSRVAQLGLVPTLATFASRSAISTPPRFAINYFVRATLAVFAETHRLRASDAERDDGVSRKPPLRCYTGITYSIKSGDKISRSLEFIQPVGLSTCAA
jgi:hypothetical protein